MKKKITKKDKDLKKLIGLVLSENSIKSLINSVTQARLANMPYGEASEAGLTSKVVVSKILAAIFTKESMDFFRGKVTEIYLKYYNGKDISAMLKFYQSATGKKLLKTLPETAVDMANAGQEWSKEIFEKSQAKIEAIIDEEFERIDHGKAITS